MAVVDICLSLLTICSGDSFGSLHIIMCIWSLSVSMTSISKSEKFDIFCMICFMSYSTDPISNFFLYLHTGIMWYLMRNFEWFFEMYSFCIIVSFEIVRFAVCYEPTSIESIRQISKRFCLQRLLAVVVLSIIGR